MSYRIVLPAFLKGMIFSLPLLGISLGLKNITPTFRSIIEAQNLTTGGEHHTFYFIGTSRVQRSISPEILKSIFPQHEFVNLGIANNSFLYSCQAASNLLDSGPANQVIFIELTGMVLRPSDSYYMLMNRQDIQNVIARHLSIRCSPEDVSNLLFCTFSVHSDLKKIIFPKLDLYQHAELGYVTGSRKFEGPTASILTPESFSIKTEIPAKQLRGYLDVINDLQVKANKQGSKIVLMLPLTITEQSEFNIDMSVFARLPEENKWSYSHDFLRSMNNAGYLSDGSHLNESGARKYTRELADYIGEKFVTR